MLGKMTKWEYGIAEYDGSVVSAHIDHMPDVYLSDTPSGSIPQFLNGAGALGWELCAVVPVPTSKPNPGLGAPTALTMIFKRPGGKDEKLRS